MTKRGCFAIAVFLFGFFPLSLKAQFIHSFDSSVTTGNPNVEPYIAVNPNNPSELMVTSMEAVNYEASNLPLIKFMQLKVSVTKNGGMSWDEVDISNLKKHGNQFDPWLIWDKSGEIFLSYLSFEERNGKISSHYYLTKTQNYGESWTEPIEVFPDHIKGLDHPIIEEHPTQADKIIVFATYGLSNSIIAKVNTQN